ncbi:uncharacterized protein PFL1_04098 [Pseudozyma flocculosa PF-1]|uniref:Uncharacterized protein n=2 Tax=Pseudozyma flocculosa TaxID=84751 RepID=A0A5C3ETM3_9BASI|nr:uncharacterized protein PFL1_04098 [Pseudozyma flocculosa PF-1]EPQ28271.1 hypothetical protein PFL1_04098 [Pseudozyma flocculosa PF-1]SPO35412.1 uncharacterized protein PSFLO_00883 [Pseudozyma flocculosa]
MVKFTFAPVALVAFLAGAAFAQDSSSSGAPAPSSSMSSSAAPSSSMSSSSAAPSPTSMSMSSSAGGSGGGSGGSASGVCTVLAGDDPVGGCPYSSTSTPPYDLNSLMSYLIGGYTRGPEAREPESVANELAGSVVKYYPTLTVSREELQQSFLSAIEASITAVRNGDATIDAAPANIPASLVNLAVAGAAIAAAGAFML